MDKDKELINLGGTNSVEKNRQCRACFLVLKVEQFAGNSHICNSCREYNNY